MSKTDQLIDLLSEQAPSPKRASSTLTLLVSWVVGAASYVALITSFGMRADLMQQLHGTLFMAELLSLVAIIVLTGLAAAFLAFPDIRQQRAMLVLPVLALLAFIGVVVAEYMAMPAATPLPPHDMECTSCILLYAAVPAAWLMVLLRHHATTHPAITGSMVVLAATSIGALILRLVEQTDSIPHLITWHYAPMFVASIIGMVLGKIFLKW